MSLPLQLSPRLGKALVVGAGPVGARKVDNLVAAGFRVIWVDPKLERPSDLPESVEGIARPFEKSMLDRVRLVFTCTNNREVNRSIAQAALAAGLLVCCSDAPEEGNFISPAVYRHAGVTVAVSTDGYAPALAAALRDELVAAFPDNLADRLDVARRRRSKEPPDS